MSKLILAGLHHFLYQIVQVSIRDLVEAAPGHFVRHQNVCVDFNALPCNRRSVCITFGSSTLSRTGHNLHYGLDVSAVSLLGGVWEGGVSPWLTDICYAKHWRSLLVDLSTHKQPSYLSSQSESLLKLSYLACEGFSLGSIVMNSISGILMSASLADTYRSVRPPSSGVSCISMVRCLPSREAMSTCPACILFIARIIICSYTKSGSRTNIHYKLMGVWVVLQFLLRELGILGDTLLELWFL